MSDLPDLFIFSRHSIPNYENDYVFLRLSLGLDNVSDTLVELCHLLHEVAVLKEASQSDQAVTQLFPRPARALRHLSHGHFNVLLYHPFVEEIGEGRFAVARAASDDVEQGDRRLGALADGEVKAAGELAGAVPPQQRLEAVDEVPSLRYVDAGEERSRDVDQVAEAKGWLALPLLRHFPDHEGRVIRLVLVAEGPGDLGAGRAASDRTRLRRETVLHHGHGLADVVARVEQHDSRTAAHAHPHTQHHMFFQIGSVGRDTAGAIPVHVLHFFLARNLIQTILLETIFNMFNPLWWYSGTSVTCHIRASSQETGHAAVRGFPSALSAGEGEKTFFS